MHVHAVSVTCKYRELYISKKFIVGIKYAGNKHNFKAFPINNYSDICYDYTFFFLHAFAPVSIHLRMSISPRPFSDMLPSKFTTLLSLLTYIGVNISERKSGTERTKKRKKRELVCFSHRQGAQRSTSPTDQCDRRLHGFCPSYDNEGYLYPGPYAVRTK